MENLEHPIHNRLGARSDARLQRVDTTPTRRWWSEQHDATSFILGGDRTLDKPLCKVGALDVMLFLKLQGFQKAKLLKGFSANAGQRLRLSIVNTMIDPLSELPLALGQVLALCSPNLLRSSNGSFTLVEAKFICRVDTATSMQENVS